MKIAAAQINTTIGDFEGNSAKIIERIEWAKKNGIALAVFPEMAVTGYPPNDLLENSSFILKSMEHVGRIAKMTDAATAAVVGCVTVNESTTGKGFFNSAAFLAGGKVRHIQHKTLLPTYDVFDEARYFEPGSDHEVISFGGRRFGISICEDIWSTAEISGRKLYNVDPIKIFSEKKAEFIINISASPYVAGKQNLRHMLVGNMARKHGIPIVFANLVGGNDELVFDGASFAVNMRGEVVIEAGAFVEDSIVLDMDALPKPVKREPLGEPEEIYRALVLGVRDYVHKCGFKKVVVGLSGGVDSAVVAAIAVDALGKECVMGISMPTRYTSSESVSSAEALAENLGISFEVVDIDGIYECYLRQLDPFFEGKRQDATEENLQARIRGATLMAFSNKCGALVLSTGNKSELAVGYCTLYGDMTGGLAVISDVPKTLVYGIAKHINRGDEVIPAYIMKRPPTAELRFDQKDQDDLPPYDVLDPILKAHIEDHMSASAIVEMGFRRSVVDDVLKRISGSEYKRRQAPPGIKVTSKAFGYGRRYPIACKS